MSGIRCRVGGAAVSVNFNGRTISIRGYKNVSSITDNAVGDYTVNFINDLPNTDYSVSLSCTGMDETWAGYSFGCWAQGDDASVYAVGSFRFQIGYAASTFLNDQDFINFMVFEND